MNRYIIGVILLTVSSLSSACKIVRLNNQSEGVIDFNSDNQACRYHIEVENGYRIVLKFNQFSLDYNFAHLDIYDGKSIYNYPLIGCLHGDQLPSEVRSSDRYLTLNLHRHRKSEIKLHLNYSAVRIEDNNETPNEPLTTNCEVVNFNNDHAITESIETLSASNKMICFRMKSKDENRFLIEFTYVNLSCTFDYVNVYNGKTVSSPLLTSINKSKPSKIITNSNEAMILFRQRKDDSSCPNKDNVKRTRLQFRIVPIKGKSQMHESSSPLCSLTKVNSTTGTLTSPVLPGHYPNYPNMIYCVYHLTRPSANVLRLKIREFHTEQYHDTLSIYVNRINSRNHRSTLSGDIGQRGILIKSNEVFLVFRSNSDNNNYSGFRVDYEFVKLASNNLL